MHIHIRTMDSLRIQPIRDPCGKTCALRVTRTTERN